MNLRRPGVTPSAGRLRGALSTESAREAGYGPRSWTRSGTRTRPAPGSARPSWRGATTSSTRSTVVLERVARNRPERSLVLTGLRGVGKTVLLNALRSQAVRKGWGTGKLEARPDQGLRKPLASALHQAVRELGHPQPEAGSTTSSVVLKAFAQRDGGGGAKLRDRWSSGIDAPAVRGRADSGDIEIDLVELFTDLGGLAADTGQGVAVFIDEMQDLGPDDVSALCAACHELVAVAACR